jgi:aryl-alcohol dehydrogenase-like predicted oxidoreductase
VGGNGIPRRVLGKSGIEVTSMGIGLWAIGGGFWGATDDSESLRAIDAAVDAGITFFDTADIYGDGHSEELLGQAMKGRREKFIVATKIGWQGFDEKQNRSAYDKVDKVVSGVEASLQRLQTDYVDLIQCHIDFRDPNMETFVAGFQKLQSDGKVRAFGLSSGDFDYLRAFNAEGGCATLQTDYSILNRTPEAEILPYCREHNIGIIVRGPLAMGILTGKFHADHVFAEDDFRRRWQTDEDERRTFLEDLAKVDKLRRLADGRSLAQLALQFVLANPAVSVVIPGAKTESQLRDNLAAVHLPPLSSEELAHIDRVTPPGGGRKIWPA